MPKLHAFINEIEYSIKKRKKKKKKYWEKESVDFFFLGIHCSCFRVRMVNLIGFNYDDYTKHETTIFVLKIKNKI